MSLDIRIRFNHSEDGWLNSNLEPCKFEDSFVYDSQYTVRESIKDWVEKCFIFRMPSNIPLEEIYDMEMVSFSNDVIINTISLKPTIRLHLRGFLLEMVYNDKMKDICVTSFLFSLEKPYRYFVEYIKSGDVPKLDDNDLDFKFVNGNHHVVMPLTVDTLDEVAMFKLSFDKPIVQIMSRKECETISREVMVNDYNFAYSFLNDDKYIFSGIYNIKEETWQ